MVDWVKVVRAAIVSGSCAGLGSTLAMAAAARLEGKAVIRPINATSHWLNGETAGVLEGVDGAHSAVGLITNQAASIFWAVFFEAWQAPLLPPRPARTLRDALALSVIAAAVDYGATPKRFSPGWELVLSRRGMAIAYGGMAVGLWAGAVLTDQGFRLARS